VGADEVIQKIRADRRDVEERIKGAEGTLMDDQGRDREAVIKGQLPDLRSALAEAETLLKAAEEAEGTASRAFEEARVKSSHPAVASATVTADACATRVRAATEEPSRRKATTSPPATIGSRTPSSATRVAGDALQLHGGYGYVMESPIQRLYRDVKLFEIGEGTSQIHRNIIARQLGL